MLQFLIYSAVRIGALYQKFQQKYFVKKQHSYFFVGEEHPMEVLHLKKYLYSLQKPIFASNIKTPQRSRESCAKGQREYTLSCVWLDR